MTREQTALAQRKIHSLIVFISTLVITVILLGILMLSIIWQSFIIGIISLVFTAILSSALSLIFHNELIVRIEHILVMLKVLEEDDDFEEIVENYYETEEELLERLDSDTLWSDIIVDVS